MPQRSKRHHFVPQLHLRAFGTAEERIATVDRRDDRAWVESIETAAAENDYNTIRGADGQPSDEAERVVSELEGLWGPALTDARIGDLLTKPDTKVHLAFFIAFQYVRVPRQRSFASQLADQITKLDIAAGGPRRIRAQMEADGLDPTDDEVLAEWDRLKDFDSYAISRTTEQHLATQFGLIHKLADMVLAGYQWTVMRWERCHLLTSDDPVILQRAADHPAWSGTGFATAACIQLAIARDAAIILSNRSELAELGHTDPPDVPRAQGNFKSARALNWSAAAQARRFVYHHPDDTFAGLVGTDHELPPLRDRLVDENNGIDLRSKLVAMSEWAYANPDEPHPISRMPDLPEPPPGARIVVVDGRTRRLRAMQDLLDGTEPAELPP